MEFCFKAEVNGLMITLTAERIYRSKQSERYKLTIAGTDYKIVVQTNRPAVDDKKGKRLQWHIAEGTASEHCRLDNLYQQLEKAIRNQPAVFQGTLNFIDHF